jgi:hypothetical protein
LAGASFAHSLLGVDAMTGTKILCRTCLCTWPLPLGSSVYAQQAIESCPCPSCGANTLSCVLSQAGSVRSRDGRLGLGGWVEETSDDRSRTDSMRRPLTG